MFRPCRIAFKLSPELCDVDAQILCLIDLSRPPHLIQQLAVCQNFPGVFDEYLKKPVFMRRQVHFVTGNPNDASIHIEFDAAKAKYHSGLDRRDSAAKSGAYAREQFTNCKRFLDIVIGAEIEG